MKVPPEEIRQAKLDLMEAKEIIEGLPEHERALGERLTQEILDIVKEHGTIGVLALTTAGLAAQLTILQQGV